MEASGVTFKGYFGVSGLRGSLKMTIMTVTQRFDTCEYIQVIQGRIQGVSFGVSMSE